MSAWQAGRVMADHLAELGPADSRAVADRLAGEINALLGLDLESEPDESGGWPGLRTRLAADLEARLDAPTAALVAALACDKRSPAAAFVEDLAEILFVPRALRSEYRFHSLPSKPWRIERLLLEYAIWSRRLDDLQTALTKAICAGSCERLPVGCCSVLGYDLGLVPDRMLALQRIEAVRAGWTPPVRELGCRYHTPRGCVLRLFKSPACIGFMCQAIEDRLCAEHGPLAKPFLDGLDGFQRCDLDRARIFAQMETVVRSGEVLLGGGGSREARA